MAKGSSYNCPSCNTINYSVLEHTSIIVCKNCGEIAYQNTEAIDTVTPCRIPEDWSFLQIGSGLEYNQNTLTAVGRIRLQLRNDYKNLWCAALNNGTSVWIMESFASFCMLGSSWTEYNGSVENLHAGMTVQLKKDLKVKGEYVEKCEGVSYEGEIGNWKLFQPGFFFIQCSNNTRNTAVFVVDHKKDIAYLTGGKIDVEKLNLKNTITWDGWR
jgi:hypothetical protein